MRLIGVIALAILFATGNATAQEAPAEAAAAEEQNPLAELDWVIGPKAVKLAQATLNVPEGFMFLDQRETTKFQEIVQNPTSGRESLIAPDDLHWFGLFEFEDIGYVKDDEKDDLDADGILESIRTGTEEANKERARRGWGSVHVVGWERPPFYNESTHNLEWAIRGRSDDGESVNYSTRLLGRRGVMSADLVLGPDQLAAVAPAYQGLLDGFRFKSGETYAEFSRGDKIAAYGLTALVAGGAGAIAAKTGLLARFWKLIVAGVLAAGAFLRRIFSRRPRVGAEGEPPATAPG